MLVARETSRIARNDDQPHAQIGYGDKTEYQIPFVQHVGENVKFASENILKDSGSRTTFGTGAQRDRQRGKGAPALVPNWVIWLVSRIYEDGSYKYSARNWEKGMPLSQYIDSAERHLAKLKAGLRDEPHATQVIWNMIGYVFTAALIKMGHRPAELNDMPNQLSTDPLAIAEPLSPHEYDSLDTFFELDLQGRKAQGSTNALY